MDPDIEAAPVLPLGDAAPVAEENDAPVVHPAVIDRGTSGPSARRSLAAAALSWLFPGLGQLVLGCRRSALVFAVPTLVFLAWVVLQLEQGAAFFAVSLWDDNYLRLVLGVVAGFGLWRVGRRVARAVLGSEGPPLARS